MNYKNPCYTIPSLASKESFIKGKIGTLEDILNCYFQDDCDLEEIECVIVCWIDAWEKARDTKECCDNSLFGEVTDFIEFLYQLIIGSQRKIIKLSRHELEKIASSN